MARAQQMVSFILGFRLKQRNSLALLKSSTDTHRKTVIDIMRRRLEANVLLIKALGGGWDVSTLPKL
jgi:hypothetical protein